MLRCREMAHRLFQDHTGGVNLSKFRSFVQRLQQGMTKLEFAHYDIKGMLGFGQEQATQLVDCQAASCSQKQVRAALLHCRLLCGVLGAWAA